MSLALKWIYLIFQNDFQTAPTFGGNGTGEPEVYTNFGVAQMNSIGFISGGIS